MAGLAPDPDLASYIPIEAVLWSERLNGYVFFARAAV
jgi:hypothetical protein